MENKNAGLSKKIFKVIGYVLLIAGLIGILM